MVIVENGGARGNRGRAGWRVHSFLELIMRRFLFVIALASAPALKAQDRGAARLHQLVAGLTVTPRVLVIGAHPDDDDAQLITWLARGRSVQTAYLSLTRGESGQNWAGPESGGALSAVRTREALAARRIDGGELFFTRAIDFGISKNADDTFAHWPREQILGDIVTIVRAFRPHVIVSLYAESNTDGNGHHQAAAILAREVFEAAIDTMRFRADGPFGQPWRPLKLYRRGSGLEMRLTEYDPIAGRALAEIALESRMQHRSQGLTTVQLRRTTIAPVTRVASRVNDDTPASAESSIFDGVDTSFARLAVNAPADAAQAIARFAAYVDSVRARLDLAKPGDIVPLLAQASRAASTARRAAKWCEHPTQDAEAPPTQPVLAECDQRALDLDASIDLVKRRVDEALLLAAGVAFETGADRDLVAATDTIPVWVTMHNRGTHTVTLSGLSAVGSAPAPLRPIVVPPDSAARHFRMVSGLVNPHPWWLGQRERVGDMFRPTAASLDGIERVEIPTGFGVTGIAVPEAIRRESDVTVTVEIEGATITRSLGPALYQHADPFVGVQSRPIAGSPAVSLAFERSMEWMPSNKPIARQIRLAIKSLSDRQQEFKLNLLIPAGMRVDSAPETIVLAPKEQRELFLRSRSVLDTGRHIFAAIGNSSTGERFTSGFKTLQYSYLEPVRFFRSSGIYVQAVNVTVPPALSVVYVSGSGDDTPNALRGVGVPVTEVSVDDLLAVDLSKVTTLVIGPRAFEAYPQLMNQQARLFEFANKGGTVVVLSHAAISTRVLPYPIVVARPVAEHVASPAAPVAMVAPSERVLKWPNAIDDEDWKGWAGARAEYVPTTVDPRWTTVVEMHDEGEKPNRNAILVAKMGKGAYLYTALSLTDQIEAGVPGALRLLVNMLSAAVSPDRAPAARR